MEHVQLVLLQARFSDSTRVDDRSRLPHPSHAAAIVTRGTKARLRSSERYFKQKNAKEDHGADKAGR